MILTGYQIRWLGALICLSAVVDRRMRRSMISCGMSWSRHCTVVDDTDDDMTQNRE